MMFGPSTRLDESNGQKRCISSDVCESKAILLRNLWFNSLLLKPKREVCVERIPHSSHVVLERSDSRSKTMLLDTGARAGRQRLKIYVNLQGRPSCEQ